MKIQVFQTVCLCLLGSLLASCGSKPYMPPPEDAQVESFDVLIKSFGGRPDVFIQVRGYLSSGVAQLIDAKQRRDGYRLFVELQEQTPRGAKSTDAGPARFDRRIPVETLGLLPGRYIINVNGVERELILPRSMSPQPSPSTSSRVNETFL